MDEKSYGWGGGIGFLAILFILIFAFRGNGWGNGFGGFGGWGGFPMWGNGFGFGGVGVPGYGLGFEDYKAICEGQKQGIIDSAQTRYLVEQQAAATQAVVNATANTTQTKIDFYAYQDLRDRLSEEQRKVLTLENQLFVKDQLAPVNAQLASIQCHMLKRPDVTGIGAVCPNSAIINGLGINSLNGYGYGCGCSNLA